MKNRQCNKDSECRVDQICQQRMCTNINTNKPGIVPILPPFSDEKQYDDITVEDSVEEQQESEICILNLDCPNGQICVRGVCKPKTQVSRGCRRNMDCNKGFQCIRMVCQRKWQNITPSKGNKVPNEERCRTNIDCEIGFQCKRGKCKSTKGNQITPHNPKPPKKSKRRCRNNLDCQNGFDCKRGFCQEQHFSKNQIFHQ